MTDTTDINLADPVAPDTPPPPPTTPVSPSSQGVPPSSPLTQSIPVDCPRDASSTTQSETEGTPSTAPSEEGTSSQSEDIDGKEQRKSFPTLSVRPEDLNMDQMPPCVPIVHSPSSAVPLPRANSDVSSEASDTPSPYGVTIAVPENVTTPASAADNNNNSASTSDLDEYGVMGSSVPSSPVIPPSFAQFRRNSSSNASVDFSLSFGDGTSSAGSAPNESALNRVPRSLQHRFSSFQMDTTSAQLLVKDANAQSSAQLGAPGMSPHSVTVLNKSSNLMYNEKERVLVEDILSFFINEEPHVVEILFSSVSKDDLELFMSSLMNLTFSRSVTLKLVRYFMEMEFKKTAAIGGPEGVNTLFRENSTASKLLKCYLQKIGGGFLQEILGPLITQICLRNQRDSFEIDSDRVEDPEERKHNRELLTACMDQALFAITSHAVVVKMPPGIRIIAAFFDEFSKKYCPEVKSDALIGSFLMLRYFNPAIMSPEVFGLLPPNKQLSQRVRRNLILIGKVLQNMSNGVLFSSNKETYMMDMNPWLELNLPRLQRSYHEIVMTATSCSTNLIIDSDVPVTATDIQYFHQCLFDQSDAVFAAITSPEHRQQLKQKMDALGTYARKISFATELDPSEQAHVRATLLRFKEEPSYVCSFEATSKKKKSNRIFVVGQNRLFLMRRKRKVVSGASIVKAEGHILDLMEVRLSGTRGISLIFKSFDITGETDHPEEILSCVKRAFLTNFSHYPQSKMFRVTATPPAVVPSSMDDSSIYYRNETPCDGYVRTYNALCDYYGAQLNEMLCGEIDTLYSSNRVFDVKHLFLEDMSESDFVPVLHALCYNTHFKSFINDSLRFRSSASLNAMATLMRENATLTSVQLPNIGLSEKSIGMLVESMSRNKLCAITNLNLRGNAIDEKVAGLLGAYIASRQESGFGFKELDLESTMHSPKVSGAFFRACTGTCCTGTSATQQTLATLNLANNKIGDTCVELTKWLNVAGGALASLNLSGTGLVGAKLNTFLVCLSKRCTNLRSLDVSYLKFSHAEILTVSQLFLLLRKLDTLNLSGSVPKTASLIQFLPLGTPGTLITAILRDHQFGNDPASLRMLHETMPKVQSIKSLDLSNTDLGDDGVFCLAEGLTLNTNVRHLYMNGVFRTESKRPRTDTVRALCKLVQSDCPLETLSMAGGQKTTQQLGRFILPLLQALEHNTTLTSLDVSGHMFGSVGAITLAKTLQINATLTHVSCDQNDIGVLGLTALSYAIKINSTVEDFPLPIMDISTMLINEKSAEGIRKIRAIAHSIEQSVCQQSE